ncbi:hypothetical protein KC19_4G074800 [Ceratodon purpureus]|uniref:Remorin C-terminal domain-containing protein n=1 Tax=Ceratodon purpureus TaxID=3225 RepID=A0A8T0I6K6_CERPU|nr:hypothetical protein KC19_4G074800 [Ceratodon purpureus]KAG0579124.1 hypothetical protein KC19_4G074800 [Ceratodon purpureus]KAG0579125.1 hypothetical protein KC19_4G074800 [Ceratodon purpureus]KAG0579127.1 hypothetical protein KC19_4G074800 [Ceratodon purpureus]KAG0579130.1 hypothetical protein KC19_4G074800 [Ceratodon purpureus]
MTTMVMTAPQTPLPTSNGHTVHGTEETVPGGIHIDIAGLEEECYEEPCNQSTPRKPRAAAELPNNIFSSFKNVMFGSNGPIAPETQNGNPFAPVVEQAKGKKDVHIQEDQNDSSYDTACNGHSEEDPQEKLDFLPVREPQELASAFPPTFGHSSSSHAAEDQNNNPPASHPTNTTTRSPSRPSSPYVQGQDVHINCAQRNSAPGSTQGDAVVSATTIRSASFQSAKGEYPQSQFLLTISAPSPSGIVAAGGAQLEHLLARVKHEKTVSRARAWEEGAKAKAHNRYTRDESKITAWENTMKAKAEARMRKAQENLDKQRAKHIEKMKNAVASAHCKAQEKRAAMEARRAEDIVKAEETASRIRATGKMPRKCLCLPA